MDEENTSWKVIKNNKIIIEKTNLFAAYPIYWKTVRCCMDNGGNDDTVLLMSDDKKILSWKTGDKK
jgi:hypothetical protein